jgi:hypothetical protein
MDNHGEIKKKRILSNPAIFFLIIATLAIFTIAGDGDPITPEENETGGEDYLYQLVNYQAKVIETEEPFLITTYKVLAYNETVKVNFTVGLNQTYNQSDIFDMNFTSKTIYICAGGDKNINRNISNHSIDLPEQIIDTRSTIHKGNSTYKCIEYAGSKLENKWNNTKNKTYNFEIEMGMES